MRATTGQHWLIYALGGGLGHLTRAISLGRGAGQQRHTVHILCNSPFAADLPLEDELPAGSAVTRIDPHLGRAEVAGQISEIVTKGDYDALVVDTFPRGLGGELPPLLPGIKCPKILVHRDLNPQYVRDFDVSTAVKHFDRLLVPGEPAACDQHTHAVVTAPWLIRDHDELLDTDSARRVLQAPATGHLVVVLGSGRLEEVGLMADIATRLERKLEGRASVRFIAPRLAGSTAIQHTNLWPLLPAVRAIDLLVGAGGYNTVNEAHVTHTPLLAFAHERLYDRQTARLRPEEMVSSESEMVTRAVAQLGARPAVPLYDNGVHEAARIIATEGRGC
ncbi:MAG: hypothetical protein ABIG44_12220 [Planctomycetota bacterium]